MMPPSPLRMESLWMSSSAATQLQPGQISPSSAGLINSSAPTMVHSASSSCADSWSTEYVDRDDVEMDNNWEQGSDDVLTIPKLEPVEDDLIMDDLKAAPLAPASIETTSGDPKPKRPRGRPRKHPLTAAISASKVTKGRSKTGCITCRKRKKKCDEAKPRCMNCEKNAVVCEGYHEKQIWKSGKEKAEEERLRQETLPIITMQPIFHGVETVEDKVFWKHYITHLSNVLTVEGEAKNAFKDIILHLANEHQGLMHSILAVSSKHIEWDTPYGAKLLADHPQSSREALQQRADYHHDESMKRLYEDMGRPLNKDDPEYKTILSARYGQMLCLLLQTRADGNPRGEHRVHLQAYQTLIQHSPPEDPVFYTFITEFFQYHVFADDLFWHPENMTARLSSEDWEPTMPIQPPRLLGVGDGLFQYLSQITTIRNTIRVNIAAGIDPVVDYTSLYQAAEIDAAIREWTPNWPWGDSRDRVGLLYKQMMWVYLFRTIYPPSVSSMRRSTFSTLPIPASASVSVAPPPPVRRASMMAAVSRGSGAGEASDAHMASSCPTSRNPSRTNSMHEQDSSSCQERASSPPPTRRPAYHDRRITLAVEESLIILESFKPSDPSQTLLLIPCLIIGTACFEGAQQERIRTAVRAVRGYTGLRNCERVMELLEKVWVGMGQGDWVSVWDWQGIARRMRLDFTCA
ncbi:Ff.00g052000.m01.CDS01 [Fusarium sp. VM40]|nr:Ff.00g052000.m01.CDS01 [Fusarium sp. VM40]